jgi:MFS family permease
VWTGEGLGLLGFLVASAFWSDTAAVLPDTGPIVQVNRTGVMIGSALIGLLFGAIVAGLARSAAAWANPAMELSNSKASTAWIGAVLGLLLGFLAGVILVGLGTPIEGSEEPLAQLPVLATMAVMVIGGGLLGVITAAVPQLFGTPVAVDESDQEEVEEVKSRLGSAVSIPMIGAVLLLLLVLPLAYLLIESNELVSGGASLVAILVSGGILGFATLAGSKPEMRISLGDVLVAIAGIGTVLVIIVAVLLFNSSGEEEEGGDDSNATAIVQVL